VRSLSNAWCQFFLLDLQSLQPVDKTNSRGRITGLTPCLAAVDEYLAHLARLESTDPTLLLAFLYHLNLAFLVSLAADPRGTAHTLCAGTDTDENHRQTVHKPITTAPPPPHPAWRSSTTAKLPRHRHHRFPNVSRRSSGGRPSARW
jgi:hypothetical protein